MRYDPAMVHVDERGRHRFPGGTKLPGILCPLAQPGECDIEEIEEVLDQTRVIRKRAFHGLLQLVDSTHKLEEMSV
jgi:hypothetical protein